VVVFGATKLLQKRKIKLKGNIRFVFQNSEETLISVKVMIKISALENPNVDFVWRACKSVDKEQKNRI
jgi:metal-dependent amidase/aminoacylase/carboxypeptidase family protein